MLEQQDEIVMDYVSVSQRRQYFEANKKFKHNNFKKIASINHAKRIAIDDEQVLKVQKTSDIKINISEMYNEDDTFMSEIKELGSIKHLKLLFEKR
ncbi:hypothetical protein ACH3XW_43830 [Acanthocheilonema viteae]